jgi:hypothetical protein
MLWFIFIANNVCLIILIDKPLAKNFLPSFKEPSEDTISNENERKSLAHLDLRFVLKLFAAHMPV